MLTLFLLSNILVPYFIYTLAATLLGWSDRRFKSPVKHTNELMAALLLGTTLYYTGGYIESFHYATPLITLCTILAAGRASEVAALQTGLRHFRSWSWQMWTLVACSTLVAIGFAVIHTLYAVHRWGITIALAGYLGSFCVIPVITAVLVWSIYQLDRQTHTLDPEESELHGGGDDDDGNGEASVMLERQRHSLGSDSEAEEEDDEEEAVGGISQGSAGGRGGRLRTLPPVPIRHVGPVKIRRRLRIHLHHYQIFAYLAAFTRFPTLWSQCAAGLALGCMMHGIAAYGVDSVFEYEEDTG